MRRLTFSTFLLALVFLLSSCASHRYVIVEPQSASLKEFTVLEIKDFDSNLKEETALEVAGKLPAMIVHGIKDYNIKHPDAKLFSEVTQTTEQTDNVLVIDGLLLSYEEGSRAKRYWLGFGAGKAYCTIQCTFINKKTGEEILKANFEGELAGGIFGGKSEESAEGVVKAIIDYLEKHY